MATIKSRIKHVSLAFMGDDWKDGYLDFRSFRFSDINRFAGSDKSSNDVMQVLKDTFVSGKSPDEGGSVYEVKAEDLDQFDAEAINQIVRELTGQTDPN